MLTETQIEALQAFDGRGALVLSAYLDLDPARQVRRSYRVVFEDLVKQARAPLQGPALEGLGAEAARVREWLESPEPRGKGLALFSCTPRGLWQAHVLHVRVTDHLVFEPSPDVGPLLELLDEYERYAVALVDKETARLFAVFMGEIEEITAFTDLVPGKHDQGGLSQAKYQHHHEAHVHWHLKRVAQQLAGLLRRRRLDRLILAGPDEATSELRRLLPRVLAHRLVAVVPAKVSAGVAEILELTLRVERGVEREVEERLLGELLDMAGPAGRATVGVSPTLDALWADLVQTLVVAHRDGVAGSECPNCGRLEPGPIASCPACGKAMTSVHDLFHRAMARAREQAGSVEVMHGAAARRLLDVGEGLGAVLRYRWAAPPGDTGAGRG
jgi:peptide chain release factor subunit 1